MNLTSEIALGDLSISFFGMGRGQMVQMILSSSLPHPGTADQVCICWSISAGIESYCRIWLFFAESFHHADAFVFVSEFFTQQADEVEWRCSGSAVRIRVIEIFCCSESSTRRCENKVEQKRHARRRKCNLNYIFLENSHNRLVRDYAYFFFFFLSGDSSSLLSRAQSSYFLLTVILFLSFLFRTNVAQPKRSLFRYMPATFCGSLTRILRNIDLWLPSIIQNFFSLPLRTTKSEFGSIDCANRS